MDGKRRDRLERNSEEATYLVKVELLCDVFGDESTGPIALPGCTHASAMNLHGPGAALDTTAPYPIEAMVPTPSGPRPALVELRRASLGGYVVAKASAITHRGLDKDLYDLAYIVIHNDAGGPQEAATRVRTTVTPSRLQRHEHDLHAAVGMFTTGIGAGPTSTRGSPSSSTLPQTPRLSPTKGTPASSRTQPPPPPNCS
jgi:hypothetical protein